MEPDDPRLQRAHGPQQVNNGEVLPAREVQTKPIKLLKQTHGERLDTGATGQAISSDPAMATMGAVYRPEDARGQSHSVAQRLEGRSAS
jgi:hypothetical protein